jgi:hypothetical protein
LHHNCSLPNHKIVYGIGVFFGVTNGSSKAEGTSLVLAHMLIEVTVVSGETIDQTFSSTTIKDEHANLEVGSSMEEGSLISIQPDSTATHVATICIKSYYYNCTSRSRC